MLIPVKSTACPVADCGNPLTPRLGSMACKEMESLSNGAADLVIFLPPSRDSKYGMFARRKGLVSGLSSPKPMPSRKRKRIFIKKKVRDEG